MECSENKTDSANTSLSRLRNWRVSFNGNLNRLQWCRTPAYLSRAAQDGSVVITSAAAITDTYWHVFQNHKTPFVPNCFSLRAALSDRTFAMFAFEIVHCLSLR